MVPLGFFRQVVPRAHADLGVSWSSFNYLEAPPAVALDAAAPPAEFAAARHQAFSEAGHHALVKLLRLRANEIRPGGHLVAAIAGHRPDDAEGEPPSTPGIQPLQAALMRMVGEGQLTIPELMRTALFHSHERTPREMHAALADEAVAPLWELEVLEPRLIEHPAWAIYQDAIREDPSRKNEALRTYARAVFDNMVAASGWFWADVLRKSRGDNWDADAFLQEVTDKAVEECVDKFADMKVQIWYNNIRLKRTDKAV